MSATALQPTVGHARFTLAAGNAGRSQGHAGLHQAVFETEFTEELKKFDIRTWIAYGDDAQIVPIGASGLPSPMHVQGATLEVYAGGSQGLTATQADECSADRPAFIQLRD
ncbi:hypothetical protein [Variovorax saccharolyticus]|uniref:hypothetical protein n=1 Tax=Variovorax saccharolyticus TaxID=3053516 RepID=UPI002575AF51|nr:hypothetical protein [Variovorax sp. J31P216]MDM0027082.1 hypothetical protein [Variovorax sp. J31P216]